MILFFGDPKLKVFAVKITKELSSEDIKKLSWALNSVYLESTEISEKFIGPKSLMISPWSTNAVEITKNMGLKNINRIEEFTFHKKSEKFDKMVDEEYPNLNQKIFDNNISPEKIYFIDSISDYNDEQGLALDDFEISYLENLSKKIGRKLSDSEVYGLSLIHI